MVKSSLKATRVVCPTCSQPKNRVCKTKNGHFALKSHAAREQLSLDREKDPTVYKVRGPWSATPDVDSELPEGHLVVGQQIHPFYPEVRLEYNLTTDTGLDQVTTLAWLEFVDYAEDYMEDVRNGLR